jgi:hypothetical protein
LAKCLCKLDRAKLEAELKTIEDERDALEAHYAVATAKLMAMASFYFSNTQVYIGHGNLREFGLRKSGSNWSTSFCFHASNKVFRRLR